MDHKCGDFPTTKKRQAPGMLAHACNPNYSGVEAGGSELEASPRIVGETLFQKVTQVIECLPSKPEALGSNSRNAKKEQIKRLGS
jgi:hypothetical protein